jgi:hypothetical protein
MFGEAVLRFLASALDDDRRYDGDGSVGGS